MRQVKARLNQIRIDRPSMQDRAYREQFVCDIGVTTFEDLKPFKREQEVKYNVMVSNVRGCLNVCRISKAC